MASYAPAFCSFCEKYKGSSKCEVYSRIPVKFVKEGERCKNYKPQRSNQSSKKK